VHGAETAAQEKVECPLFLAPSAAGVPGGKTSPIGSNSSIVRDDLKCQRRRLNRLPRLALLPAGQAIFRISDFSFEIQISLKDFRFSASFPCFHHVGTQFAIVPMATTNQLRSLLFAIYAVKKRLAHEIGWVTISWGVPLIETKY
jgi:hypothetical protein